MAWLKVPLNDVSNKQYQQECPCVANDSPGHPVRIKLNPEFPIDHV